jgi:putative DNA methylase
MANALKPGSPLAFTYHHNDLSAYYPVAVAILDAGLTCSASLPCPAEMGASIHINGTGSSIIDTVFVCRSTGVVPGKWIVDSAEGVARLVTEDIQSLRSGNVHATHGDIRCIAYGHLVRLAIWALRKRWKKDEKVSKRMARVAEWLQAFGTWGEVEKHIHDAETPEPVGPLFAVRESAGMYGAEYADIPFCCSQYPGSTNREYTSERIQDRVHIHMEDPTASPLS